MHKVNYLRAYRKQTEIRQSDIAFLLDMETTPNLSRYEKGRRFPSMNMLLVYHMLFNRPIHSFFSNMRNDVKENLLIRMKLLIETLETQEKTNNVQARIEYLNASFTRLKEEHNEHKQ